MRSISRGARTVVPAATTPRATIPGGGEPLTVERAETICAAIAANPILDGVTLSGGDPLLQPEAMAAFLAAGEGAHGAERLVLYGLYARRVSRRPGPPGVPSVDRHAGRRTLRRGRCAICRSISGGVPTSGSSTSGPCTCSDRCVKKELQILAALFYARVISTDAGGPNCRLRPCFCRCAASHCRRPRSAGWSP